MTFPYRRPSAMFAAAIALAVGCAASAATPPANPASFAAWKTAHRDVPAKVSDLKAKTAAMVKAYAATHPDISTALDQAPVIWRAGGSISELWDNADAPQMVVVPAGEYTMGADTPETIAAGAQVKRLRVRIQYPYAFSKYAVTVGEFAHFMTETGYDAGDACQITEAGVATSYNWRNPGFAPSGNSPVVCVNAHDAEAYAAWLSKKTGHHYRLPSDAEYEFANRAGTSTDYWWGNTVGQGKASCVTCGSPWDSKQPHPVGSLEGNPFGLFDTTGNVWAWTADCWDDAFIGPIWIGAPFPGTPSDGSPAKRDACDKRVVRGGGYRSDPANLRAATRHGTKATNRFNDDGFFVVREL